MFMTMLSSLAVVHQQKGIQHRTSKSGYKVGMYWDSAQWLEAILVPVRMGACGEHSNVPGS